MSKISAILGSVAFIDTIIIISGSYIWYKSYGGCKFYNKTNTTNYIKTPNTWLYTKHIINNDLNTNSMKNNDTNDLIEESKQ